MHTETTAREYLESLRWPSGAFCPHCGAKSVTRIEGASARPGLYQCNPCHGQFTVTVGTIFEKSKIPLAKWLEGFRLMAASKKGVSAHQLHRTLGITYKSAWFLAHRIREAMANGGMGPLGGIPTVEVDEAVIAGRGSKTVLAIAERGGRVRAKVVPDNKRETLHPIIAETVLRGSEVHTDKLAQHLTLPRLGYHHKTVNHTAGEYARGSVTTNSVEGFFGIMKRGISGVYQHINDEHAGRYVAEFEFRHNHRIALGWDDKSRADAMIKAGVGKRLTYKRLIGKEAE